MIGKVSSGKSCLSFMSVTNGQPAALSSEGDIGDSISRFICQHGANLRPANSFLYIV
ncbi:conserved hypothetical protein [Escherichia coli E22]|nr:conserved hypothetical protein [Escherichia coli E22]